LPRNSRDGTYTYSRSGIDRVTSRHHLTRRTYLDMRGATRASRSVAVAAFRPGIDMLQALAPIAPRTDGIL
jgi:hypothetical protein